LMSFLLGQQIQKDKMLDFVNTALLAVEAALDNVSNLESVVGGQLTHTALVNGLALFGDNATQIQAWAMHSSPYFDLMGNAIGTNGFDTIASSIIQTGSLATLNRPAVVTDSSSLTDGSGSSQTFNILGLVPGAIQVIETGRKDRMVAEVVTGKENLVIRLQGEYEFAVRVKGFKWGGSSNPNDAAVGTASNWTKTATQDKACAGVHILATT